MKAIEPPDVHYLRAAIGWLQLDNHLEAHEELEQIAPRLRVHPDVLEVRWQIYAKAQRWDACLNIANVVVELAPHRSSAWLDLAYSLRRVVNGGLEAAFNALLPAAERFPADPLIPYNLSCYACQMGRLEDACNWLVRAFATAGKAGARKRLGLMALDQPELKPLWRRIGEFVK